MIATNRDRIARRYGVGVAGVLAVLASLAGPATVAAQPVSSFADLGAGKLLGPGDAVTVEDAAGRRHDGKVQRIDGDSVTLRATAEREALVLAERDVVRITRRPANHVGIGAAVGAGAGFALTAAAAASYGRNEGGGLCVACLARWSLIGVPLGAAGGALVGLATGRASTRTVFLAPDAPRSTTVSVAPVVSRRAHGAVVTVRW